MDEVDFKEILNFPEIKKEYDGIKSLNKDYFMIIRECFVRMKAYEKYLNSELIKGMIMLKIDNVSRILGNIIAEPSNKEEYIKMCVDLNKEFLDIFNLAKTLKKHKNNEDLEELKNYYLSIRHLIYYYKVLIHNYNIKVNELINSEKGIMVVMPMQANVVESKNVKEKIKKYYEVK